MPNPSPLDEADEKEIVERYTRGATTRQLADRFGVSEAGIRRALERQRVTRRPEGYHRLDVTDEQVVKLRDAGLSWRSVADHLGMSVNGVRMRYLRVTGASGSAPE